MVLTRYFPGGTEEDHEIPRINRILQNRATKRTVIYKENRPMAQAVSNLFYIVYYMKMASGKYVLDPVFFRALRFITPSI
jgi:hypothetical protein